MSLCLISFNLLAFNFLIIQPKLSKFILKGICFFHNTAQGFSCDRGKFFRKISRESWTSRKFEIYFFFIFSLLSSYDRWTQSVASCFIRGNMKRENISVRPASLVAADAENWNALKCITNPRCCNVTWFRESTVNMSVTSCNPSYYGNCNVFLS